MEAGIIDHVWTIEELISVSMNSISRAAQKMHHYIWPLLKNLRYLMYGGSES